MLIIYYISFIIYILKVSMVKISQYINKIFEIICIHNYVY